MLALFVLALFVLAALYCCTVLGYRRRSFVQWSTTCTIEFEVAYSGDWLKDARKSTKTTNQGQEDYKNMKQIDQPWISWARYLPIHPAVSQSFLTGRQSALESLDAIVCLLELQRQQNIKEIAIRGECNLPKRARPDTTG